MSESKDFQFDLLERFTHLRHDIDRMRRLLRELKLSSQHANKASQGALVPLRDDLQSFQRELAEFSADTEQTL